MVVLKCKWMRDDFSEICTNADCPVCGDFCPSLIYQECCKFAEFEGKKRTQGDKVRAMTDEEILRLFGRDSICGNIPATFCCKQTNCEQCILDWLKQVEGGGEDD